MDTHDTSQSTAEKAELSADTLTHPGEGPGESETGAMGWQCRRGHANRAAHRFCTQCGQAREPLGTSRSGGDARGAQKSLQTSTPKEPDPSQKYYQKARDAWDFDEQGDPEKDRERWLKIASYLQIAINLAKGPVPDVLGRMAIVMVMVGDNKNAEHYSNLALSQQRHNVFGWLARLCLAMIKLEGHNPWYATSDFGSLEGAAWSILTLGAAAASRSSKVSAIATTSKNLAWAFGETVRLDEDLDVEDWLTSGEILLNLADQLKPYGVNALDLYRAVFGAQWARANLGEWREQVEDLRARAHALYQIAGGR